jgi:hypothetical protein
MSGTFIMALGIIHNFLIDERQKGNPDEDDEEEIERLYAVDLEAQRLKKRVVLLDKNIETEEIDDQENVVLDGKERLAFQIQEFNRLNNF